MAKSDLRDFRSPSQWPKRLQRKRDAEAQTPQAQPLPDLIWRQACPEVWERGLDELEKLHRVTTAPLTPRGVEHVNVSACVRLDIGPEDISDRVWPAWRRLRHEMPSLASYVQAERLVYHTLSSPTDESAWRERTLLVVPDMSAGDHLPTLDGFVEMCLIWYPSTHEFLLRGPHYLTDGMGLIYALNRYLDLLVKPIEETLTVRFGSEHSRLSPCLSVGASLPPPSPELIAESQTHMAEWAQQFPSVGVPVSGSGCSPDDAQVHRREITFSVAETSRLLAACRAEHRTWTPTHVVQAAFLLAAQELGRRAYPDQQVLDKYGALGIFNLRERIPEVFGHGEHPFVPVHMAALQGLTLPPMVLDDSGQSDLSSLPNRMAILTETVQDYYRSWREREDLATYNNAISQTLRPIFALPKPQINTAPVMSSLGIIDDRLQTRHIHQAPGKSTTLQWTKQILKRVKRRVARAFCLSLPDHSSDNESSARSASIDNADGQSSMSSMACDQELQNTSPRQADAPGHCASVDATRSPSAATTARSTTVESSDDETSEKETILEVGATDGDVSVEPESESEKMKDPKKNKDQDLEHTNGQERAKQVTHSPPIKVKDRLCRLLKPTAPVATEITIDHFWLSVEPKSDYLVFYLWTFQGRMCMSVCFSDQYWSAAGVEAFLDLTEQYLRLGMGTTSLTHTTCNQRP